LALERCAIGLGRTAAKIFYVEAGHAPILNERLARTNRRGLCAPHFQFQPKEVHVKRRILLVDDDLAVLLTLKAVLELQGFEVETAGSSAEAVTRMESGVYQMVISDLRMETEEAGLEVIRTARRQAYNPATALLTAFPPSEDNWGGEQRGEEQWGGEQGNGERSSAENSGSLLIKPLGTDDLLRQLEALLVRHADRKIQQQNSAIRAQENLRRAG
jgi:CheY-like chemotaxis protein